MSMRSRCVCAGMVALLGLAAGSAWAQDPNFDARQAAQLQQMMAANAAGMQRTQQAYMQQFGPMLRQQYVASGASQRMSFDQYAYYMMMTANGTNVQGGLQAQQDRFNGLQGAHRTLMEGYNSQNQGWQQNSTAQTNAVENWTQGAINGQAQYVNPQTGAPQWMPYSAPGQVQNYGGTPYVQSQNGTYWQFQGNSWVPVQPYGR